MTHLTIRAVAAAREAARRRDGQFGHQHRGEADIGLPSPSPDARVEALALKAAAQYQLEVADGKVPPFPDYHSRNLPWAAVDLARRIGETGTHGSRDIYPDLERYSTGDGYDLDAEVVHDDENSVDGIELRIRARSEAGHNFTVVGGFTELADITDYDAEAGNESVTATCRTLFTERANLVDKIERAGFRPGSYDENWHLPAPTSPAWQTQDRFFDKAELAAADVVADWYGEGDSDGFFTHERGFPGVEDGPMFTAAVVHMGDNVDRALGFHHGRQGSVPGPDFHVAVTQDSESNPHVFETRLFAQADDGTVVAIAGESLPTRLWEGLQGRELAHAVAVRMVRERNKLIRVADAAGLQPTSP